MTSTPAPRRKAFTTPLPDWSGARCAGAPEWQWTADDDRETWGVLAMVCEHCPVRAACLAFAEREGAGWGVWGGRYFGPGAQGRPRKAQAAVS